MSVPPSSRTPGPVPGLFESHTINLIIGTSGAGKTQFLLNQLENYGTGGGFLNHAAPPSGPVQLGMLACNRAEDDIQHSLVKFPFLSDQQNFPYAMWEPEESLSDSDNFHAAYDKLNSYIVEARRPVRLLIIENLQALMTSGKILDTKLVKEFCNSLRVFCRARGVTIIGTVGTPKMKGTECYPQLADRIPGANCWASEMATLMGVERIKLHRPAELRPAGRKIIVQTSDAPDEVHWGKFLENGKLDVSPDHIPIDDAENDTEKFFDAKLAAAKPGTEFKVKDLVGWGEEIKVGPRTVERWATKRTEDGALKRTGHANKLRYIKPLEQ